jgi:hypothetical protein
MLVIDEFNNQNQVSKKNEEFEDSDDYEEIATSEEEDHNEFHPTSIYDYDQPTQNIYTYPEIAQKSNALNIDFIDDDEPLQSIDSIVAEIEYFKQQKNSDLCDKVEKEKFFEKNECSLSSSSICTVSSPSSNSSFQLKTKDSIKSFKLENQQQIFKTIYKDQINQIKNCSSLPIISTLAQEPHSQKKRSRKSKEKNIDKMNLQNKNRTKRPSSNLSNSSCSEFSSPSSSRKNSADLSTSIKLKKNSNKKSVILTLLWRGTSH